MGRKATRKRFECKWCGIQGEEHFTKQLYTECRSCRTAKGRDVCFPQFVDVLKKQKLASEFWKS